MNPQLSRRMRLIINGKSAGDPELRAAVNRIRSEGQVLEVRVTWEGGDAARYSSEATTDGIDVVIAGGGDGTINEVVGGLMSQDADNSPAIAVLPYGTANDFANGCGIPTDDPYAALLLAATGDVVPIDVGRANDDYFINIASGGFGAEVTVNTPKGLKDALGGAAYTLMGIVTAAKATPSRCRVTLPDGTVRSGEMLIMTVANGRQCGGGQQVAPKALLNDGLLDFAIVHDVDLRSFGKVLSELLDADNECNQFISYAQVPSIKIESDEPIQVNLDGEPVSNTTFAFSVERGAARFVLPSNAPLASQVGYRPILST